MSQLTHPFLYIVEGMASMEGAAAQAAATGTVEVGPYEAVDAYLLPLKPGHYSYWCDEFLHATFGMTGDATVQ